MHPGCDDAVCNHVVDGVRHERPFHMKLEFVAGIGLYFDLITVVALQLLDLRISPTARMIRIGDVFKAHALRGNKEFATVAMITDVEHRLSLPSIDDALGPSRGHWKTYLWVDRIHNGHVAVG